MKKIFLVIFQILLFSFNLFSQQVRITGQVKDGETGKTLPGATIIVEGTQIGTASDLYGNYSLLVPNEESVLVFSFISYESQRIIAGNQQVINVELQLDVALLNEVVITLQAKGQIAARRQQIDSETIMNVVAPDRLQENPDASAAEALGRLPGVSLIRTGGEGTGLVVRGLEPRYSNITLDGIALPSIQGNERSTDISGISQYALQGVEVYKVLTPDLEANAVGGSINLTLQDIPVGAQYNLMSQGGYNHQNNYYSNYRFLGGASNRFFNDRLGIALSINAERVNRSAETMSASYELEAANVDILLNNIALNKIRRLNSRQSATLSMDYMLHRTTKVKFHGFYTNIGRVAEQQSKNYNVTGTGGVTYNQTQNKDNSENMLHAALKGETKLTFLNAMFDYGTSYSIGNREYPNSRSWSWGWQNASRNVITTRDQRRLDPTIMIPMFDDHPDSLHNTSLNSFGLTNEVMEDINFNSFININIPYNLSNQVKGYLKFGGAYRVKSRFRDRLSGTRGMDGPYIPNNLSKALPWVQAQGTAQMRNPMNGLEDYIINDYLGGQYNYGLWFRNDRLNEITDWWINLCDSLYAAGQDVWSQHFFTRHYMGFMQNVEASMIDDQDLTENYGAGYFMTNINWGRWLTFMPGIRYEITNAEMKGKFAYEPFNRDPTFYPLPTEDTKADRSDAFLLPMIHLRIKPISSLFVHLAYTKALSRPDFNAISPNTHTNPERTPYAYTAQNPKLKAEQWTNFDVQITAHSNKLGLLSVTGFQKIVDDKIWKRAFKRIASDTIIYPFAQNAIVDVSIWENHQYDITLKGVEFEWQTSFWYLPKPFNFFTLYLNYTYTQSETIYPYTALKQVIPPGGGRPQTVRVDSTTTGPMLYQPKHIINTSLGFNVRGFNIWLSHQYNGEIYTYKHYILSDLDIKKEHFNRMDFQITYTIPNKKMRGIFQVVGNVANITNFTETSRMRGDPRFTYQEAYGITVDLGLRYRL